MEQNRLVGKRIHFQRILFFRVLRLFKRLTINAPRFAPQEPQRVFTNNIVVRFHPGLEMDGDEIITIVCRYPPPVAPVPAGLPAPM